MNELTNYRIISFQKIVNVISTKSEWLGRITHEQNPDIWEAEEGGSQVQGHPTNKTMF